MLVVELDITDTAYQLYSGLGFTVTGTSTSVPGLRVTHHVRAGE